MDLKLRVKKLNDNATIPKRGSAKAVGYDLSSAVDVTVPARGKALISTGVAVAIPEGTYGRVAPRSGLAWKKHIDIGAGVVDPDYRGDVGVVIFNHAEEAFEVKVGDRVAQLVLERVITPDVEEVTELDATERGEKGYGSTGMKRHRDEPVEGKADETEKPAESEKPFEAENPTE